MNQVIRFSLMFFVFMTLTIHNAIAKASCAGVLNDAQRSGFQHFFSPSRNPGLSHDGGPVDLDHMSKRVTNSQLKELEKQSPTMTASAVLTAQRSELLKGWLNDNSDESIPGWFSTAIGVFVPASWIGLGVDLVAQFLNAQGDAGRRTAANIAGTVSANGKVATLEQVVRDASGNRKYLFTNVYNFTLNNKSVVTPLSWCVADLVVT